MTPLAVTVLFEPEDLAKVDGWLEDMGKRAARAELLPILKDAFGPVVAAEKSNLSGHSKSGALVQSLSARAGAGDRPGKISVFSAPTATRRQAVAKWSKGRRQQRGWAATEAAKGMRGKVNIFYAEFVHQGHRIVKRNAKGELYDTGDTPAKAVPFALAAIQSVGEAQADVAAEAILRHICEY